jgi:hypothetical protein
MPEIPITVACGNYDRTAAIRDGRVRIEGCAVTYLPLYPEEIFHRAFKYQEFDVSELSFSSHMRTVAAGTAAYVGVPAFVSRLFRHSGIYIRNGAGISKPEDLRGKRIGLRTGATWVLCTASFGLTLVLAIETDASGLPALPLLSAAFILANADLLWQRVRRQLADRGRKRPDNGPPAAPS